MQLHFLRPETKKQNYVYTIFIKHKTDLTNQKTTLHQHSEKLIQIKTNLYPLKSIQKAFECFALDQKCKSIKAFMSYPLFPGVPAHVQPLSCRTKAVSCSWAASTLYLSTFVANRASNSFEVVWWFEIEATGLVL